MNNVYKVKKTSTSFIELYNQSNKTYQHLKYNEFENLLSKVFDYNQKIKILEYLNESKSLIIDLDEAKALLIVPKTPKWNKTFKDTYMNPEAVLKAYRQQIEDDIPDFLEPGDYGTIVIN